MTDANKEWVRSWGHERDEGAAAGTPAPSREMLAKRLRESEEKRRELAHELEIAERSFERLRDEYLATRNELDALKKTSMQLAESEAAYRNTYELMGGGNLDTGRAWDVMRKRADAVRDALRRAASGPDGQDARAGGDDEPGQHANDAQSPGEHEAG